MLDTLSLSAADARTYSISELAREFGLTPRALRFYEDKDMLHPARDGMTRVYSNRDRARVQLIVRGKRIGLPLNDIRELLDLYDLGDGQRAQMQASLVKFQGQMVELEKQREDIEMSMTELQKGIAWIEKQLERIGPAEHESEHVRAYDAVARAKLDET
ncbi:MAG: MerR family DNA-binding transcriptional regulator [Hyphomonadaceae bacterium]